MHLLAIAIVKIGLKMHLDVAFADFVMTYHVKACPVHAVCPCLQGGFVKPILLAWNGCGDDIVHVFLDKKSQTLIA